MFGKNLITFAFGIAVGLASSGAMAVPVTTLLSASTHIEENGIGSGQNAAPASNVSLEQMSDSYDGYAHAMGDSQGNTQSISWSHATYSTITSEVHQSSTILNNTGHERNFSFIFLVDAGGITATANNSLTNGEYLTATYNMDILVNGQSIWQSQANLHLDDKGYSLTKSGVDLNASTQNGNYLWNEYSGTLSLGKFRDNQSFTLDYYLTTTVTNHFYVYENQNCDEDGNAAPGSNANCTQPFNGESYAMIGDPNRFEYGPINSDTVIPASNLPEPMGLALIGIGLAGLVLQRRRS